MFKCIDLLRSQDPDFGKKIHLLSGDCKEPFLGLNFEAIEILKDQVTCVFHVAANVRFDIDLKTAVHTNVRGVRDLLEIMKEAKNLRAFVYVSTAFSHCPRTEIREEFYGVGTDPEKVLQMVDLMDDQALISSLMGPWPNTYVYSKALAEEVVRRYENCFPICIVRPAISKDFFVACVVPLFSPFMSKGTFSWLE